MLRPIQEEQEPLGFRLALRAALDSRANRTSVISDADRQCLFPAIAEHLCAIQRHLSDCEVQPADCLTLELANSLPSALAVLACLDAGHSVMLMPIEGRGARAVGRGFLAPRFSRWTVTVRNGKSLVDCDLSMPSTYLDVRLNPDYDVAAAENERGRRLYLRTSGSLGAPKLAVHSHERFLRNVRFAAERLGFNPSHRVALPTPIFHAYGLGPAFLGCLLGGASIDLQERSNLLRYFEREQAFEPNVAFVTPAFCETLVRGRRSPRAYELMVTGGDRIGRSTFFRSEEIHGPLINAYGSTEMGFIFAGDLSMSSESRFRTVGRPLPGVLFRIVAESVDKDAGEGALQIKHENGFEGYVDLNGKTLVPPTSFDGDWYCSGDVARVGPEGMLEVLGRSDLSVNRNGLLLTFADVEALFRELEGVEEAGVAAGREGIRGRELVAFCVLGRGVNRSEEELRVQYAKRAPAFAVPEYIRVVEALPKLPTGKIDRARLTVLGSLKGVGPSATLDEATAGQGAAPVV